MQMQERADFHKQNQAIHPTTPNKIIAWVWHCRTFESPMLLTLQPYPAASTSLLAPHSQYAPRRNSTRYCTKSTWRKKKKIKVPAPASVNSLCKTTMKNKWSYSQVKSKGILLGRCVQGWAAMFLLCDWLLDSSWSWLPTPLPSLLPSFSAEAGFYAAGGINLTSVVPDCRMLL